MREPVDINAFLNRADLISFLAQAEYAVNELASVQNRINGLRAALSDIRGELDQHEKERERIQKSLKYVRSPLIMILAFPIGLFVGYKVTVSVVGAVLAPIIAYISPFSFYLLILIAFAIPGNPNLLKWLLIVVVGIVIFLVLLILLIFTVSLVLFMFFIHSVRKGIAESINKKIRRLEDERITDASVRYEQTEKELSKCQYDHDTLMKSIDRFARSVPRQYLEPKPLSIIMRALREGRANTFAEAVRLCNEPLSQVIQTGPIVF